MKKKKIIYWISTGIFCAFMTMASITDLIPIKEAVEGFQHLGYPTYLLPFLGVARILGVIALLVPGYPRIKEWAYAGFFFDIAGAIYSVTANHDPFINNSLAIATLVLFTISYYYYHKLLRLRVATA